MLSDRSDLVEACVAAPADHAPRLILADQLAETAHPHAALWHWYWREAVPAATWLVVPPGSETSLMNVHQTLTTADPALRLHKLWACLCVRLLPIGDGRTVWNLLADDRSRAAVAVTELSAVDLVDDARLGEYAAAARTAADGATTNVYAAAYVTTAYAAAYAAYAAHAVASSAAHAAPHATIAAGQSVQQYWATSLADWIITHAPGNCTKG